MISANYVRANGTVYTPGERWASSGLRPQRARAGGASMLVLSSGHARTASQPGACGCTLVHDDGDGTAPPDFPQDDPDCPPSPEHHGRHRRSSCRSARRPTPPGYSFNFKFYSFEYPELGLQQLQRPVHRAGEPAADGAPSTATSRSTACTTP